jgi:beta-galactosidase
MLRKMLLVLTVLALASPVFAADTDAPKPVAYWSFDAVEDGKTKDEGEHKLDGIVTDATPVDGNKGKALAFDGEKSRVVMPANLGDLAPKAITVTVWIKPSADIENYATFFHSGALKGMHIRLQGPRRVDLNTAGVWHAVLARDDGLPDRWTHVAATFDGKTARLYLNGKQVGEKEKEAELKFDADVIVGCRPVQTKEGMERQEHFKGVIDEVKVFNVALTADQVKADCEAAGK